MTADTKKWLSRMERAMQNSVAWAAELKTCKSDARRDDLVGKLRRLRDSSPQGASEFYVAYARLQTVLGREDAQTRSKVEAQASEWEKRLRRAVAEEGTILPGKAFPFVVYCNRRVGRIEMMLTENDGSEYKQAFHLTSDLQWEIARQLIEADVAPVKLVRADGKRVDITNIFREDEACEFGRYIQVSDKGMYARYSLVQTHAIKSRK